MSHHVHRLGLHLKAETVETACRELGYIFHKARFVKEADLADQKQRSRMAEIMARHGIIMQNSQNEEREDAGRLRVSIREMFPKMPEEDMEAIIKHAWEEDSFRVGTNASLSLSRRIQLATIARIRHTYTDYDVLLKAFGDWHKARQDVEKDCLDKLKEWRGENASDDVDESEWITRDFIVIDDDDQEAGDDSANLGHEADDEDSAADQGYASDISVEIVQHRALDDDLSAESSNEGPRRFIGRIQASPQHPYAAQHPRPASYHLRTPSVPSPLAEASRQRQPYPYAYTPPQAIPSAPPHQPPLQQQHHLLQQPLHQAPQSYQTFGYDAWNNQYRPTTYNSPHMPMTYQSWPPNHSAQSVRETAPAAVPTPPRSGIHQEQMIVDGKVYHRVCALLQSLVCCVANFQ